MTTFFYECPKGAAEIEYTIEPLVPGKYYGPPENCYPDDGGYADGPDECGFCHTTLNPSLAYQAWEDSLELDPPDPDPGYEY